MAVWQLELSLGQIAIYGGFYIISILFRMMNKKKMPQSPSSGKENLATPSLSRLEKISALEREVISILGKRTAIDPDLDLFSRIEEMYLRHLQKQPLGRQVLQSVVQLIGEADAPAKVRMLYLLAHEIFVTGGDPTKVLVEGFQACLNSRHKTVTGYECGLVLAQLTQFPREVDQVLSNLVVSLEREVGFRPLGARQRKGQEHGKTSVDSLKSVYIGGSLKHRSFCKSSYEGGKLEKLELSKCLYEAYSTGCNRIQSEARRHYYQDCRLELKRRLLRQNPGLCIEKKLKYIDQGHTALSKFLKGWEWQQQNNSSEVSSLAFRKSNSHSSKYEASNKKKSCGTFEKQLFVSNEKNIAKDNIAPKEKLTNSNGPKDFKFEQKPSRSSSNSASKRRKVAVNCVNQLEPRIQERQSKKSLVLKFSKLANSEEERKTEVRRRKLKGAIQFQPKKVCNRAFFSVLNVSFLPNQNSERCHNTAIQTECQFQKSLIVSGQLPECEILIESLASIGDETSSKMIDMILKEGIEEIAYLDNNQAAQQFKSQALSALPQQPLASHCKTELSQQELLLVVRQQLNNDSCSYHQDSQSITRTVGCQNYQVQQLIEREEESSVQYRIVVNHFQDKAQSPIIQTCPQNQLKEQSLKFEQRNEHQAQGSYIKVDAQEAKSLEPKLGRTLDEVIKAVIVQIDQSFQSSEKESGKDLQEKQPAELQAKELFVSFSQKEFIRQNRLQLDSQIYFEANKTPDCLNYSSLASDEITQYLLRNSATIVEKLSSYQSKRQRANRYSNKKGQNMIRAEEVQSYISKVYLQVAAAQANRANKDRVQLKQKDTIKETEDKESLILEHIGQSIEIEAIQKQDYKQITANQQINESSFDNASLSSEIKTNPADSHKEKTPKFQAQSQESLIKHSQSSSLLSSQKNVLGEFLIETTRHLTVKTEQQGGQSYFIENISGLKRSHKRTLTESMSKGASDLNLEGGERQGSRINFCNLLDESVLNSIEPTIRLKSLWLSASLKIGNSKIVVRLSQLMSAGKSVERTILIPEAILSKHPDIFQKAQTKIQRFLKQSDQDNKWQGVVEQLNKLNLLPDQLQAFSALVFDELTQQPLNLGFYYAAQQKEIFVKCDKSQLKLSTPEIEENGEMEELIQKIHLQQVMVKEGEIMLNGVWSAVVKKNIKLRDTYSNTQRNFIFRVFQCFDRRAQTFSFKVKGQEDTSMSFKGISFELRPKVISNIDTLIGFALKVVDKKLYFMAQNINNVIKLL